MNFNDLLRDKGIDQKGVLVLRHRPQQPELNRVLPWLAAEKHDVFNAYQQAQRPKVERAMVDAKYVAGFIGHEPGKALFVGLYSNKGHKRVSLKQFWENPDNNELRKLGMSHDMPTCLWFDLELTDYFSDWKGKLIIRWPPLDRSWSRWAHKPKNEMPIHAILDDSALDSSMPDWQKIDLSWTELANLPKRWQAKLSEWRGIYYIFDMKAEKGYVGAAYGSANLLGRWLDYATRGHGGNRLLRQRDPKDFRFSILQRVSPDLESTEVIRLEATWKDRLHTQHPIGLNDN